MHVKEKNLKQVLGKRVKSLRRQAQLSQVDLAERCGIYRTYLSRIESCTANPTLLILVALAEALGVEPGELLEDLPQEPGYQILQTKRP